MQVPGARIAAEHEIRTRTPLGPEKEVSRPQNRQQDRHKSAREGVRAYKNKTQTTTAKPDIRPAKRSKQSSHMTRQRDIRTPDAQSTGTTSHTARVTRRAPNQRNTHPQRAKANLGEPNHRERERERDKETTEHPPPGTHSRAADKAITPANRTSNQGSPTRDGRLVIPTRSLTIGKCGGRCAGALHRPSSNHHREAGLPKQPPPGSESLQAITKKPRAPLTGTLSNQPPRILRDSQHKR